MTEASEKIIAKSIVDWIKSQPNSYARKVHGGAYGTVGEPDIDACVNGRAVKIEVKRPSTRRRVTANQKLSIKRWASAGAVAFVACSIDDVEKELREARVIS